ncbi:MAG: hypothetical protein ACK4R7_03600 [Fervidobacterium sp.]
MQLRKFTVFILLVSLISSIFAAGSTQFQLQPTGSGWSQTLTFSVRQWIKVTWDYDETQVFAIDDATGKAQVGNISFQSNKQFKVFFWTPVVPSGVVVTSLKIGSTEISSNESFPTTVISKILQGQMEITFFGAENQSNDFNVKFDFVFLPL